MENIAADICGELLVKKAYKSKRRSLNAWAPVNMEAPEASDLRTGAACYAGISRTANGFKRIVALVDKAALGDGECSVGDHYKTFTRSELVKYYSYLATRSPYRTAFITKSGKFMVDNSYAIINADKPANLVVAALTAQRQAWEYTQIAHTWLFLRKHQPEGNENWHFYLASLLKVRQVRTGKLAFTWYPQSHSHAPLASNTMQKEHVANFINGRTVSLNDKLSRGSSFQGVQSLFGSLRNLHGMLGFAQEVKETLEGANDNPVQKLFSWNKRFFKMDGNAGDDKMYDIESNLVKLEKLYQKHFGGNQ